MRRVIDAIMYVVTHGNKWRGLPSDFPPWQTVYRYFVDLQKRGRWRTIHYALYKLVRDEAGREPSPSLLIIDSQSVKTGKMVPNKTKGFDGGKRIKGRKRHVVVDSLGLLVDVSVTPANTHDTKGAVKVLKKYKERVAKKKELHRVKKVIGDKGYRGEILKGFVRKTFKAAISIGENHTSPETGFVPATKRWLVERGFAWLGDYRRLTVDQERSVVTSMSMIRLAFIRLMLRRLEPV
jgi:putative transposase